MLPQRFDPLVYRSDAPRQILVPLPRHHKPGLPNHAPELLLAGELLNALYEILVTIPIPRDQLPNHRYSAEAPALVHGVEERVVDLAELEAGEYATGLEDAERFAERRGFVGEVADAKGDRVEIQAPALNHVQILGVGLDKVQPRRVVRVTRGEAALAALGEHLGVDVGDGDARQVVAVDGGGVVEHAEGDVACAARHVEDVPAGLGRGGGGAAARVQGADEVVFPEAVDAEGHKVVHCVVGGGYGGEDCADCCERVC